uniref:uncharacterized protein LOC120340092 n=1 Tax=Styela clava TaxID=7725 RepID=UPI00193ABA17|nr:uncharacterized protein LOC120340092 [Styela clava]
MVARAKDCVYWPGMNKCILNFKSSCSTCSYIAPSQVQETIIPTPPPQWPFQQICADLFYLNGNDYIAITDRFSGWIEIAHFHRSPSTKRIIPVFEQLLTRFGCAEELSTDGGPQFASEEFKKFLEIWGVKGRISSAHYPQSNGRAELAVKTVKRLIRDNLLPDGSPKSRSFGKALLQYRNTPLRDIGLSPAQLLFSRHLRDFLPIHPSNLRLNPLWTQAAKAREKTLSQEYIDLQTEYNKHAHDLPFLEEGTNVSIQNPINKRWDRSGKVVKCFKHRKYLIRMDGSGRTVTRNRRFLKPILFEPQATIPISPNLPHSSHISPPNSGPPPFRPLSNQTNPSAISRPATHPPRLPLALRRLQPYNKPGLSE